MKKEEEFIIVNVYCLYLGIINVKDRIKLSVFPNTLLPLIDLVIRSLCMLPSTSSSSDINTTSSAHCKYNANKLCANIYSTCTYNKNNVNGQIWHSYFSCSV